jgi:hypothetical protein
MARILAFALVIAMAPGMPRWAPAQSVLLQVSWSVETGSSGVLLRGRVQNLSVNPASRVTLRAEGLDEAGKVVSRRRSPLADDIPSGGTAPFEIRLTPVGGEKRYRVVVEFYEFLDPARLRPQTP